MRKISFCLTAFMFLSTWQSVQASGAAQQEVPQGFGAGTTGGAGGQVVRITTAAQLKYELCRTVGKDGACSDDVPRIIEVEGTVDYAGSEGTSSKPGCDYGVACLAPYKTEVLALLDQNDHHCDGKEIKQLTFDTAGTRPLLVGSNKTVLGIGSS